MDTCREDLSILLALVCKCQFKLKTFEVWPDHNAEFYEFRRDKREQRMLVLRKRLQGICWFLVDVGRILHQGNDWKSFDKLMFSGKLDRYEF